MGFGLTLMAIVGLVLLLNAWADQDKEAKYRKESAMICFTICTLLATAIYLIFFGVSYSNYVSMEEKRAKIEQDVASVVTYTSYGVASFLPNTMMGSNELTDLKYNSYQVQLAELIKTTRNNIQSYNETLVGKQVMKSNWYWSWLIYLPKGQCYRTLSMAGIIDAMTKKDKKPKVQNPPPPEKSPDADTGVEKDSDNRNYNYNHGGSLQS